MASSLPVCLPSRPPYSPAHLDRGPNCQASWQAVLTKVLQVELYPIVKYGVIFHIELRPGQPLPPGMLF